MTRTNASTMAQAGKAVLFAVAAAVALVAFVASPSPASAATTITVNTTADEANTDGNCSLREAILAANTNAARDAARLARGRTR